MRLAHAPVIVIRGAFSSELCEQLIGLWANNGTVDSYTMTERADGGLERQYDHSIKRRRDHFIEDEGVLSTIRASLRSKVVPIARIAFRTHLTRFEDFRIGCYDASDEGFFGPHRDDSTEGTSHRLFALSTVLNSGQFKGGELRFPEFEDGTYSLRTGDALLFSSALIHEVLPVTAGRRFALLSFLYGESESEKRKAYYRRQFSSP